MDKNRRRWRYVSAFFFACFLVWGGWAWWRGRSDRNSITEIEFEMMAGRFAIASHKLSELLDRRPGWAKAAFLLGNCEKERGRYEAAEAALARVAPGSEFAQQAIQARMRLAEDRGRFAEAERLINQAADDSRNDGTAVRAMLVPLYSQLGRVDEALRLVEARWEHLNAHR